MREIKVTKYTNLFDYVKDSKTQAAVVTTNGIVRQNGCAVMGAGIARYARDHFIGIDRTLGNVLKERGNRVADLGLWQDAETGRDVHIITMPTKNDWRDPSKLWLIEQSAQELQSLSVTDGPKEIFLPMPGCNNGGLSYAKQVQPLLNRILDDRFIVLWHE